MLSEAEHGNFVLNINVEEQTITTPHQDKYPFDIDPFHKYSFTHGVDEMDYILSHISEIENFGIKQQKQEYSTLFNSFSLGI